jgi:predicted nucleic acid-binding protein
LSVLVVDASVAVKWFFPEDGSQAARALGAYRLHAPDLLLAECANVFWRKVRAGDMTASEASHACRLLASSSVVLHPITRELISQAFEISLQLNHPVYDCVYLALALELDAEGLMTADERLANAASQTAKWNKLVRRLGK